MRDDLTDLLGRLVSIDSVNPALVPGGAGEPEIAAEIAAWSRAAGLHVEVLEATPGRPSVIVTAHGRGGGRRLLLCAHTDTVGVAGMDDPHAPRLDGDRLYGRGAYDMKAGLAAALVACRDLAGRSLAGDIVVAAVADEEHASLGVQEVLGRVEADAAIVTEPTELEVAIAHKGFVWIDIDITGRAAHGSRPHLGVDAIVKAGPVLTALGELDAGLGERTHALLGRASVHASLIAGGTERSTYPGTCSLSLERRTLPGETADEIEREIGELLARCQAADPTLVVDHRLGLVREPFEIAPDEEIVRVVAEAAASLLPAPLPVTGVSYWADSAFIAARGIPTVLFGPGGEGAHAVEEWVSVSDTVTVARALIDAGDRFCA